MPLPGRSASVLCAALLSIAPALAPAVAHAQPVPSSDARDSARKHAERGYDEFQAGKYAQAIASFEKAEQLFHAPPHLLFIARAQAKLGKLLAARAGFDAIVAERLASYAPDAFVRAQDEARAEAAALRTRLPTLELRIRGAAPSAIEVQVDGAALPVARERLRVPVDPGKHTVIARSGNAAPITRTVTAVESTSTAVELYFDAEPGAAAGTPPDAGTEPSGDGSAGSLVPPVVAFVVGGVGLGVGAVTGAMSLSTVSDIEKNCTDAGDSKRCRTQDESDADTARTLGTVSTVGFVVGGVGVATGVVLLLLRDGKATAQVQTHAQSRRAPSPTPTELTPLIGDRFLGLGGRF